MDLKHREALEGKVVCLQQQLEDAKKKIIELALIIEEVSLERDVFKREIFDMEGVVRKREDDLLRRIDEVLKEKACLGVEIYEGVREREELMRKVDLGISEKEGLLRDNDVLKRKNEELKEIFPRVLRVLGLIKVRLMRFNDGFDKEMENEVDQEGKGIEDNAMILEGNLKECNVVEDFLRELYIVSRMAKRVDEKLLEDHKERKDLLREVEAFKGKRNELEKSLLKGLDVLDSIRESIMRVNDCLDENKVDIEFDHECDDMEDNMLILEEKSKGLPEINSFFSKLEMVSRMAKSVEGKISYHLEKEKKEKRELERSLTSLTEENRDVNALLRIALIEKEAVEKSLSKLKGNYEQRRGPLLQFAERGLQRVGFGYFLAGVTSNEENEDHKKKADTTSETMASSSSVQSDVSSEYEEEVVSLVSTMEKMMKNLRLEIAQLRRELEESRSDSERLLSVTKKQAQEITEQTIYIQELKDREMILMHNVEELRIDINTIEEEAVRWRKACELEVEAGKCAAQEHNKLVAILTQELENISTALRVSNKKLKSKEEVAVAAMAAQSAAERCLQLADRRNAGYRQRIEELTRELEEVERREKYRRKVSRICWSWQALNPVNAASIRFQNLDAKRVLPEMQAFLN